MQSVVSQKRTFQKAENLHYLSLFVLPLIAIQLFFPRVEPTRQTDNRNIKIISFADLIFRTSRFLYVTQM